MADGVPVWNEKTGVPKWLFDNGIGKGDWQHAVKSQFRSLMRPCFPLKVRVWAFGMLHTDAYQSEKAVILEAGKRRSVKPQDVTRELHREATAYYRSAGITDNLDKLEESRQNIRRAFEALEEDGVHQRRRASDGKPLAELSKSECQKLYGGRKAPSQVHYFFWLEPRQASPESVRQEYQERIAALAREKAERVVTERLPFTAEQIRSIRNVSKAFGLEDNPSFQLNAETTPEQVQKIMQAIEAARDTLIERCKEAKGEPISAAPVKTAEAAAPESGAESAGRSTPADVLSQPAPEHSPSFESEPPQRTELRKLFVARSFNLDDDSIDSIAARLNGTPLERFQIAIDERMTRGRPPFAALLKLAESTRKNYETSRLVEKVQPTATKEVWTEEQIAEAIRQEQEKKKRPPASEQPAQQEKKIA